MIQKKHHFNDILDWDMGYIIGIIGIIGIYIWDIYMTQHTYYER